MKVTVLPMPVEEQKYVPFGKIPLGQAFRYKDIVYIRLDSDRALVPAEKRIGFFYADSTVELVDAELTIKLRG